ncbi:uncharacterized protein [Scyliorhinus torazame]|uniref:uncharacterized protein n=1 Tax=Scyliorhinus torazame TaxID=75743 RepID=UPI003B5CE61B
MMGSSIPFRSHWPKILVDNNGHILGPQHDGGNSISRKPAYRGRAPLHPPRHYCFKEKYIPHGSQAFQSLLAQYQARTMIQPGLECVGVHIPAPSEQEALAQLMQGTGSAGQPQGAQADSQGGQGTSETQAPDNIEAGQMDSQGTDGVSQGGMPVGSKTCPGFKPQCPCELSTLVCCPCKELMERELARAQCQEGQEEAGSVIPSPIQPEEDLGISSSQLEIGTSPESPEDLEGSPTTPLENFETSPEPPENVETSPEPAENLDISPSQQVQNLETSPEAPENLETSPELVENSGLSPTEEVENLETSPEAQENLETLPMENLETSPEPVENLVTSPEPTEISEMSPGPQDTFEKSPEPPAE